MNDDPSDAGDATWSGDGHPDEGLIHAWLDDALPPAEAAALERHVAGCAACSAAVAEARGLIAASSQILAALDDVPGGVLPAGATAAASAAAARATAAGVARESADARDAAPTTLRLEPRRARAVPPWRRASVRAVAAVALVAVGVTAVLREQGATDGTSVAASVVSTEAARAMDSPASQERMAAMAPTVDSTSRRANVAQSSAARPGRVGDRTAPVGSGAARAAAPEAADASAPPRALADVAGQAAPPPPPSPVPAPAPPAAPEMALQRTAPFAERGVAGGVVRGVATIGRDTAVVAGRVVASTTGEPLSGAVVNLRGRTESAVTDSAGRFRLAGVVPAGRYVAQIRRIGFEPESVVLAIRGDSAAGAPVTVRLEPAQVALSEVVVTGTTGEQREARAERDQRAKAAPAPAAAPTEPSAARVPAAVARVAGCYRLSVSGAADEVRDRIESVLPGWLALRPDVADAADARWREARSALAAEPAAGEARWRLDGDAVRVEWPAAEGQVLLRLREWAEGLAGTAVWRDAAGAAVGAEVSVLARRVGCAG